jgi:competence protein ComEC
LDLPILALVLWVQVERPLILIAESGGLIGVMTSEGRVPSKPEGDGYAAESWLENGGEVIEQASANARSGLDQTALRTTRDSLPGASVVHVSGKTALGQLEGCGGAEILISNVAVEDARPCDVLDLKRRRETGSVAGLMLEGKLVLVTAHSMSGERLWTIHLALRRFDEATGLSGQ